MSAAASPLRRWRRALARRTRAMVRPRAPEHAPFALDRRRIYVLPTRFGLFVGAMVLAMLLGALNYNNNPALLLVFALAAAAHNSLVRAHLALSGLRILGVEAAPAHAGGTLELRVLAEASGTRARPALELEDADDADDGEGPRARALHSFAPGERAEWRLALPAPRRGWQALPRLRLSTTQPYGFARAWSWLRPAERVLVYPALEAGGPPLPEDAGGASPAARRGVGDEVHALRDYRPGDAPRHVAWRASARRDQLLVRDYEAHAPRELWLEWNALAGLGTEARIRRLARWVLEAERQGRRYRLRLPSAVVGPGTGPEHRHACLRALALMPHA